MMKLMVVFGTRPETIKMAPVVQALRAHPSRAKVIVCTTAQHREILDQVLAEFEILPDVDLDLMQANQSPSQVAARVLSAMDPLFEDLNPDWVLL
jgi:UDP-N-acetylglucosamine 2-epimerase (non-hydrolysing)